MWPTVSAESMLYEVLLTHQRHLISQQYVSEYHKWFSTVMGLFIGVRQCDQTVDGRGVSIKLVGSENFPCLCLCHCGTGCAACSLECTSPAGHMSDQRHSRKALSHWCLLTAG